MAFTNIDDPTIHFTTLLRNSIYGGSDTSYDIGFQPDWIWDKVRSTSGVHAWFDSVRGVGSSGKVIYSNTPDAEATNALIKSIDSSGFTITANSDHSSQTIVDWCWKAGGSASSNTDGSITSTVSVNTDAGFSVGTYSANATSGATVGHGLGVAPDWLIVKVRNATNNWAIFHKSLGATKAVYLDQNSAQYTDGWMNNTAPSSSVFTLSGGNYGNASGYTPVFYAFAEKKGYSKFGSYNGNGNANGPFIYTGFKPAFLIVKAYSNAQDWEIFDNKRSTFNPLEKNLAANSTSSEQTDLDIDFLSNGFKVRIVDDSVNNSSYSYIFMSFAESSFVNSNGIPTNAK